ncbi:hypothetical protein O3S80_40365 [Streptomyces sp. Lzd4kr]|nr:hypothetical protein [Streptomyces sp. Lzd4kr]
MYFSRVVMTPRSLVIGTVTLLATAALHAGTGANAHATEGGTTVTVNSSGTLTVEAAQGVVHNDIFLSTFGEFIVVQDFAAPVESLAGSVCSSLEQNRIRCAKASIGAIYVRTYDGNDSVNLISLGNRGQFTRVEGGPGDDHLSGSAGAETLYGGAGDDALYGRNGNDILYGGDVFSSGSADGSDTFIGGSGQDAVFYSRRGSGVTVTTGDNLANDGAAGENDNVLQDVEQVVGSQQDDHLTGAAGVANRLFGSGGNDVLDGNDGDSLDYLNGGAGSPAVDVCRVDSRRSGGADDAAGCETLIRVIG